MRRWQGNGQLPGSLTYCARVLFLVFLGGFLLIFKPSTGTCVFDDVELKDPVKTFVPYPTELADGSVESKHVLPDASFSTANHVSKRTKRSPDSSLYKQIRIHPWFSEDIKDELREGRHYQRLRRIVRKAIIEIRKILSVVPLKANLILGRSHACQSVIASGINKGKCSRKNASYSRCGEMCLDKFCIPDEHLEGLDLWNSTYDKPFVNAIRRGNGIPNADYVLYVRSRTIGNCHSSTASVIAYATSCQLDQYERPIAGYTNFCPGHLKDDDKYNEERLIQVAIHELFHALGFSKKLFGKFRNCTVATSGITCDTYSSIVASVLGSKRLVTPTVVRKASDHFNCSTSSLTNQYGIPLHEVGGSYTSHWDPRFMMGSLMVPNIGLPHLTVIDSMTLAAFEDSGWYKVDYKQGKSLLWGKDGGCDFGSDKYCAKNGKYFCTGSAQGCHYLHRDKANCSTDAYLGQECKIFLATPGGECFKSSNSEAHLVAVHGESYSQSSKCFVSNATKSNGAAFNFSEPIGRCYETRCNETDLLEVRVGEGPWVLCPPGQVITVPSYMGTIECPPEGILCQQPDPIPTTPTTSATTTTTTTTSFTLSSAKPSSEDKHSIRFLFTFQDMDFNILSTAEDKRQFGHYVVSKVLAILKVTSNRIVDVTVTEGSVLVAFTLLEADDSSEEYSSQEAYDMLDAVVQAGNFSVLFDGVLYSPTQLSQVSPDGGNDQEKNGSIAGMIVGIVISGLILIAIVVVSVIAINKCKASRVQVSEAPSRSHSVEMHDHMSLRTINAHDIVIHGRNLHNIESEDDEGIDMQPPTIFI